MKMQLVINFVFLYFSFGHAASFLDYGVIQKSVFFELFNKSNPDTGIPLNVNEELGKDIKRDIPWKFFIHGWTTSPSTSPWYHLTKTNYFKVGEYNIVYVNWNKPANQTYLESVVNARSSGKFLGEFILHLKKNGVPLHQIHLLGHSLGSHMAGFAGKHVFKEIFEKIGRITATDPAGPLWESPYLLPTESRLSRLDTQFLDVIHTDAGIFGMQATIGHIDFFPNGGRRLQPGCENIDDVTQLWLSPIQKSVINYLHIAFHLCQSCLNQIYYIFWVLQVLTASNIKLISLHTTTKSLETTAL